MSLHNDLTRRQREIQREDLLVTMLGNDWLWRIEDGMDPYKSAVICFTEMGKRCHGQPDFQEFVETQIAPRVLEQMRQHHPEMKGT